MQADRAFQRLHRIIREEQTRIRQAGSEAFTSGDTQAIQREQRRLEQVQKLCKTLSDLQQQWQQVFPEQSAQIDRPAAGTGAITPQKAYEIPLLQALVDLGGRAECAVVLKRVCEIMADILKPADFDILPSGRDVRWENMVHWRRNNLKNEGYLRSDSPRGIWEITDKGRDYLKAQTEGQPSLTTT